MTCFAAAHGDALERIEHAEEIPEQRSFINRGGIVRASAWCDLIATAPLATPWSLHWFLSTFERLHGTLVRPAGNPDPFAASAYGISRR